MSKIKLGFTAVLTIFMLAMFSAAASAAEFTPKPGNPAPGIYNSTIDNFGKTAQHKTHGDFQNNTNSCGNCHSAHSGKNNKLVKFQTSEADLCESCHDGTLGFYDVTKGQGEGAGIFDKNGESASMHDVDANVEISAAPGTTSDSTEVLSCSSCHNPHGSANDRLLNSTVNGVDLTANKIKLDLVPDPAYSDVNSAGVIVTKSNGPVVTPVLDDKGNPVTDSHGAVMDTTNAVNYSLFCAACHDNYKTSRTDAYTAKNGESYHTHNAVSGKAGRNCATCHYAHGTDINLLKDTAGNTVADLVKKGWSESTAKEYMKDVNPDGSHLKKFTNYAVCWACHQSSHPIDTPAVAGGDYSGKPTK